MVLPIYFICYFINHISVTRQKRIEESENEKIIARREDALRRVEGVSVDRPIKFDIPERLDQYIHVKKMSPVVDVDGQPEHWHWYRSVEYNPPALPYDVVGVCVCLLIKEVRIEVYIHDLIPLEEYESNKNCLSYFTKKIERQLELWDSEYGYSLKNECYVQIAPSGKGTVYHKIGCHKCLAGVEIKIHEAIQRGFHSCATCGGLGTVKMAGT